MLRRRIKSVWLDKDVFDCPKCKTKNTEMGWNDRHTRHPKDEPENVLFCKKCGYKFTKKEELQELVNFVEKLEIGFFLRFMSKAFIPCEKCQEQLDAMVLDSFADLSNPLCITLKQISHQNEPNIDIKLWEFGLYFVRYDQRDHSNNETYIPCQDCQRRLFNMWNRFEIHIGNDTKPMIEFFRKWVDDYKMQQSLENAGYSTKSKIDAIFWLDETIKFFENKDKEIQKKINKLKK